MCCTVPATNYICLICGNSKPIQVSQSKTFFVDDLCILTDDKMKTTDDEYWEKVRERGQGWGIAGDTGRWAGWKRMFVYKGRQPSDSNKNWFLEVLAGFEGDGYVKVINHGHGR